MCKTQYIFSSLTFRPNNILGIFPQVDSHTKEEHIDAYVVVYSVEDRRSYEASINRLLEIREAVGRHVTVILVANKTDLVRCRVVTEEGKLKLSG